MPTLRVIYVHGISPTIIDWDYSDKFSSMLLRQLARHGVIPIGATQDDIDRVISFEHINYSGIGHDAEIRVLEAYDSEHDKLYRLARIFTEVPGLDRIRRELIMSVGDVLVYKSDYWRDQIRGKLLEKIAPYIRTGDPVSVVGHSLGSVVAFDTIYKALEGNPEWKDADFHPANLFTMGSPIALFSLDLDRETGEQKPRYALGAGPDLQLVRNDGVWYNFLDPHDLLAFPLESLFEGKFKVEDMVVQTGINPRHAHSGYWEDEDVTRIIAERLMRDLERATAGAPATAQAQAPTESADSKEQEEQANSFMDHG